MSMMSGYNGAVTLVKQWGKNNKFNLAKRLVCSLVKGWSVESGSVVCLSLCEEVVLMNIESQHFGVGHGC